MTKNARRILLSALLALLAGAASEAGGKPAAVAGPGGSEARSAPAVPFPGTKTTWHGYDLFTFTLEGRTCRVAVPKRTAPGQPWIWRARFWGHEPQTDLALLGHGFHVAYIDVANLFGSPKAVALWNAFYRYLTTKHGLAKKVVLEGMSRGGLIVFNWAAANPDKVACIYADAPVCDMKSWPAGRGKGRGSPAAWKACKRAYGFRTDEEAFAYRGNPVDRLEPLAKAKVPLLHVCGDADTVVPFEENTAVVVRRYRAMGGPIQVILKKGCGHHPHSLKDPAPIVAFILKHTCPEEPAEGPPPG